MRKGYTVGRGRSCALTRELPLHPGGSHLVEEDDMNSAPLLPGHRSGHRLSPHLIALVLLALLGTLLYSNTFGVQMDFDDWKYVTGNPAVKDFRYFVSPALVREAIARDEMNENFRTRKAVVFTFALNHLVHGERVFGYHLVNLLVHLGNGMLVYWLVLSTLGTPLFRSVQSDAKATATLIPALGSALFFVAHPVQTQAVTYISQRFTSMTTLLYLLSLALYVFWRGREAREPARKHHLLAYWLAVAVAVLAMFSKEIAFTLPLTLVLYEWMFFGRPTKERVRILLPFLATMLIIPAIVLRYRAEYEDMAKLSSSLAAGGGDNPAILYLFTQFRVVVTYLRLLVLPVDQNLDYDYPLYSSLFQAPVLLSLLFLCALAGVAVYLFHRSTQVPSEEGRWLRLISFGIAWFFLSLSVESSVIPLGDVIFEHRLYLPSVGFFLAAVGMFELVRHHLARWTFPLLIILAVVLVALSVATYARNGVWRSSISIWEDTVRKSPGKVRAHDNLGRAYIQAGRFAEGIPHLQFVLERQPDNEASFYSLYGSALSEIGRYEEAIVMQRQAAQIEPGDALHFFHLGNACLGANRLAEAAQAFRRALALQPDLASAQGNLGLLLVQQGDLEAAEPHLEALYRLRPQNADVSLILGDLRAMQGRLDEAATLYREALAIRPDDPELRDRLRGLAGGSEAPPRP